MREHLRELADLNFTACARNATILFESLAPGDYYYPVLWDARRASGPYTLNVIASTPTTPCPANNTCASAIPLGCNSVTFWAIRTTSSRPYR
ncbi:MAG: hypothetical protein IPG10_06670 [Flavobacteriales bacterium]|nr:hypothetical protein [Flavobacteriales bacterium]